jgi:hypothetical protein
VGDLVVGVVVDVLGKVAVEDFQFGGIDRIASTALNLFVPDSSELVVLQPKICLQDFGGGGKSQQGCVSFGQVSVILSGTIIFRENGCAVGKYRKACTDGTRDYAFRTALSLLSVTYLSPACV